ncbi:hypothetical protein ACFWXO_18540 [Kitasatospora sp. NPDC059088]|uniref:hypothetical protein n=1 Tax=Kitasatospora sp. NPDC059088 TaxID=3346722 RepID=UPI0036D0D98A
MLPVDVGQCREHLAEAYEYGPDPTGGVPAGVVPLHDWGCAMWSMIDFRDPAGAMWLNADGDCRPQGVTFTQWLVAAMDNELSPVWPDGVPAQNGSHRTNTPTARQDR